MTTQYFLPVIHPAFELLKKSAPVLHFIGDSIILINGFHLLEEHETAKLLSYFQLIIATEIYLVLFFAKPLLNDSPGLNVFFRLIETLTLVGIAFTLFAYNHLFRVGFIYSFPQPSCFYFIGSGASCVPNQSI